MSKSNAHLSNQKRNTKMIEKRIAAPSGAKLATYHFKAPKRAKGAVHILHGMGEHAGRYKRFAIALAQAGYHIYAHDHRGHGKTTAPDAAPGIFAKRDGLAKVMSDIDFINSHIAKTHPNLPITLIGHSMGSILAQTYLIENSHKVLNCILMNGASKAGFELHFFKFLINIIIALKGSDVPALFADRLTFNEWNEHFAPNRTNADWLSSDEHEVDKFLKDPLCGAPATNGLMRDTLNALQNCTHKNSLEKIRKDLPLYIMGGKQDASTNFGAQLKALSEQLQKMEFEKVKFRLYENSRHEGLNDIEHAEITKDIISWLISNK